MSIPDLIDGFITWQSTLPCRANQETPFVDEQVFQNCGVCGQAFPSLLSPAPPHTFWTRPNFPVAKKAKSASNVRKALPKRLLHRLLVTCYGQFALPAYKELNVCKHITGDR